MATKVYRVRFFKVNVRSVDPDDVLTAPDLFLNIGRQAINGLCPNVPSDGLGFEIRDYVRHNRGAVCQGVFATIRDDAPHIREAQGSERAILLGNDEGILEKNHFIYYANQSVLVYQINMRASHPTRLESYLQTMAGMGHAVTLDDMLTRDAWEKLRHGVVKQFDVTFDYPRDPANYNPTDFSAENMRIMQAAEAARVRVVLKATHGGGISRWARTTARELKRDPQVRRLSVKLEGEDSPIDLFTEVIKDKITVPIQNGYPISNDTFQELEAAKRRAQASIDEHLGN